MYCSDISELQELAVVHQSKEIKIPFTQTAGLASSQASLLQPLDCAVMQRVYRHTLYISELRAFFMLCMKID